MREMSDVKRVGFRSLATQAWPNATSAVTVYPIHAANFGDRLTALSDEYSLWRLRRLKITIWHNVKNTSTSSIVGSWGLSCLPGVLTTSAPTALEELIDHPCVKIGSYARLEIFRDVLAVPAAVLSNSMFGGSWRSTRDIGDDAFYILGRVYLFQSSAIDASGTTSHLLFEGEAEFKNSIDPDINPARTRVGNVTLSDETSVLSEGKWISEPGRGVAIREAHVS